MALVLCSATGDDRVTSGSLAMAQKVGYIVQAERQKVLLSKGKSHIPSTEPSSKSQNEFLRRWWGRNAPLEPDPRNTASLRLRQSLDGKGLSGDLSDDGRPRVTEYVPSPFVFDGLGGGVHCSDS
jgi:hypothetical protein